MQLSLVKYRWCVSGCLTCNAIIYCERVLTQPNWLTVKNCGPLFNMFIVRLNCVMPKWSASFLVWAIGVPCRLIKYPGWKYNHVLSKVVLKKIHVLL